MGLRKGGASTEASTVRSNEINRLYVEERGPLYANDRLTGGLYVIEYTGKVSLD